MLRQVPLILMSLIVTTAFLPGAHAKAPECDFATRPGSAGPGGLRGLEMEATFAGTPMDVVLCVLDAKGRTVGVVQGSTGVADLAGSTLTEWQLAAGVYAAVLDLKPRGGETTRSAVSVDLSECGGTTVVRTNALFLSDARLIVTDVECQAE